MHQRPFQQVDVFTATAYRGNPLAVVLDGTGLSTEEMQQFTRWTNLSEATFVLPPTPEGRAAGADYRVRIFYPAGELPFAGHPTLGTCHAWLKAGGQPQVAGRIVQECGVGLVNIRQQGDLLAFAAPPLRRSGPLDEADVALIARGLGVAREDIVQHAWCDNGPGWRAVLLASSAQVLALKPDAAILAGLDVGVVGPAAGSGASAPRGKVGVVGSSDAEGIAFEVRAFAAPMGNPEDPVTGSLNASLAQWLIAEGLAPTRYLVAQGECLGRAGRVYIHQDEQGQVWVGGHTVTCIEGTALL